MLYCEKVYYCRKVSLLLRKGLITPKSIALLRKGLLMPKSIALLRKGLIMPNCINYQVIIHQTTSNFAKIHTKGGGGLLAPI